MGTYAEQQNTLLQNTNGEIVGNILEIAHDGVSRRTTVTVDLFVPPEAAPTDTTFHDENTMSKVVMALYDQGLNFTDAGKIIDALLNKGLVFREIVKPVD